MSRNIRLILFGLLALAQIAVPVSMIAGSENILSRGTVYKFRTAPVDPYDAFRGRYVILNFGESSVNLGAHSFQENQTAYAVLGEDAEGFARVENLVAGPPTMGDYMRVRVARVSGGVVMMAFPFDRYYMPEDLAPLAERVVRERSRPSENSAYVTVRILHGEAKLEELHIGNQTIREFLADNPE